MRPTPPACGPAAASAAGRRQLRRTDARLCRRRVPAPPRHAGDTAWRAEQQQASANAADLPALPTRAYSQYPGGPAASHGGACASLHCSVARQGESADGYSSRDFTGGLGSNGLNPRSVDSTPILRPSLRLLLFFMPVRKGASSCPRATRAVGAVPTARCCVRSQIQRRQRVRERGDDDLPAAVRGLRGRRQQEIRDVQRRAGRHRLCRLHCGTHGRPPKHYPFICVPAYAGRAFIFCGVCSTWCASP